MRWWAFERIVAVLMWSRGQRARVSEEAENFSRKDTLQNGYVGFPLLGLLQAPTTTGVDDWIRVPPQYTNQALIDVEAGRVIGQGPGERTEDRTATRKVSRRGSCLPLQGIRTCGLRSCAPGRFSRVCWSGAAASIRPLSRHRGSGQTWIGCRCRGAL